MICTVGSCNIDLISYVKEFPKPGETCSSILFEKGFGGKGANQAAAISKLGGDSVLIAKIGKDTFGNEYVNYLKSINVQTENIIWTSDFMTGLAMITVNEEGQNTIIVNLGANMQFDLKDLENVSKTIKKAKVVVCQFEIPLRTSLETVKLAKENGDLIKFKVLALTILNPAPAYEIPSEYYEYIDILCPNETESTILSGIKVTDFRSAATAAKILKSRGCKNVVITLGKRGAFLLDEIGNEREITIKPVNAIDCTGAGDCFIGALAFFIAHSSGLAHLEQCTRKACLVASLSVQKKGTSISFPLKNELPETIFLFD